MSTVRLIFWIALLEPFCLVGQISTAGQLYPIKQNDLWGFMNTAGEVVIPPAYDGVGNYGMYNHAPIYKNKKAGMIHVDGRVTVAPVYDDVFFLNQELIAVKENGYYGVIDTSGLAVLPAQYSKIQLLNPKILLLYKNELVGLINLHTRAVIDPRFDEITSSDQLFFKTRKDRHFGFVNDQGVEIFPPIYENLVIAGGNAVLYANAEGLWGCLNGAGAEVVVPKYQKAQVLGQHLVRFRLDKEYHLYSAMVQQVIATEHVKEGLFKSLNNQVAVYTKGRNVGLIHADGQMLLPCRYDSIADLDENIVFTYVNGLRGIYSTRARREIKPRFSSIWMDENMLKVKEAGMVGLANLNGELVVEPEYTRIDLLDKSAKAYKQKELTTLNFDDEGRLVTEEEYKNFRTLRVGGYYASGNRPASTSTIQRPEENLRNDGWFYHRKHGKWGLMNVNGDTIIKPKYDYIDVNNRLGLTKVSNDISPPVEFDLDGYVININRLHGIVKHDRGRQIGYVSYWQIYFEDFESADVARVLKPGGNYGLLFKSGAVSRGNSAFIGEFNHDLARFCEGGKIRVTKDTLGMQLGSIYQYLEGVSISAVLTNGWKPVNGFELNAYIADGRWGYIDPAGKVAIKPSLTYAKDFHRGLAIVTSGPAYGVIDIHGAYVLRPRYSAIDFLSNTNDSLYKLDQYKFLYGFIDEDGRVIIETQFQNAGTFSDGMAAVKRDDKWGYIDSNGVLLIQTQFKKALSFTEGLAAVKEKRYGFVNKNGESVIPAQFTRVGQFNEGHAAVVYKGRYGLIDHTGAYVLKPTYQKCYGVQDGRVVVKQKKHFGIKDLNDRWVLPPKYARIGPFDENGLSIARRKDKYGVVNKEGKTIVKFTYQKILPFSDGLAVVRKNADYGFIDTEGNEVVKPQYNGAGDFGDGLAPVRVKNLWGYIDKSGEFVIAPRFRQAHTFHEQKAYVTMLRKQGFINICGEFVFTTQHRILTDFHENRVIAREQGKYIFLNEFGRPVPDEHFDVVSQFENGRAMVRKNGKWGVINPHGTYVFQPKYDLMEPYHEGKAMVRMNALSGIADLNGNLVIDCEYEVIQYVGNDLFRLERNDDLGYMNTDGEWVWPMQN